MSKEEQKAIFIHEIKLPGEDEFAKRFNRVGELFSIAMEQDTEEAWKEYSQAKYCLEQGLPISF
jgi:hypothetical protein